MIEPTEVAEGRQESEIEEELRREMEKIKIESRKPAQERTPLNKGANLYLVWLEVCRWCKSVLVLQKCSR